jgi:hypothetical protein
MRKKFPILPVPLLACLFSLFSQSSSDADLAEDLRTLVLGGRPPDPCPALGVLLVSADEGDATAQYALGNV